MNKEQKADSGTSSPTFGNNHVSRRTLKVWNGRGHGKHSKKHINVAAYTKKQAAELIGIACECMVSVSEITVYYSDCWGNSMNDIVPTEPCVYIDEKYRKSQPVRVL
jgi:hypothetical protein